ncbi:MAG TPA: glycosyltransferase family 2 protein [Chloroflexaceae bacterium]|nr:glycosyltransferase family 2 protein [Chloroflexaceae bacterium]
MSGLGPQAASGRQWASIPAQPAPETPTCRPGHVVVVLVHWHNIADTCACLRSLSAIQYASFGVVVVNNASADFDRQALHACFSAVVCIDAGRNLGFTGGNNLGIREALRRGAEYVLLLNPDTLVEPTLLRELVSVLQATGPGIAGPVITFDHDRRRVWFAGGRYSKLIGFSFRERPMAPFAGWRETTWLNGCAMMFHRSVLAGVGLLREGLFLYCEDLDYCLRARQQGFRCFQLGAALVHHKVSASSGYQGRDTLSPLKAYYFARNYMLLVRYHIHDARRILAVLSQFTLLPWYHVLLAAQSGDLPKVVRQYARGLWDGLRGVEGPRHG